MLTDGFFRSAFYPDRVVFRVANFPESSLYVYI